MRARLLVLAFALTLASSTFADKDPMLRQLDSMTGSYRCSGTAFASPFGPEHPTEGTVEAAWAMNDYWVKFTYAEKKTDRNPMPFSVSGWMGYDPKVRKLAMGGVDNMGGYSTSVSDGWSGDRMVWNGPWNMGETTLNGRDTFIRGNDRELTHIFEIEQDGKWMKLAEEICKKK